MANGIEDLREKNRQNEKPDILKSKFVAWKNFQGKEDAEMLQEKSFGWSIKNENRGNYDYGTVYDDE